MPPTSNSCPAMESSPDSDVRLLLIGPSQASTAKLAQKLLRRTTEHLQQGWAGTGVRVYFGSRGHRNLRVAVAPDLGVNHLAGDTVDIPYCKWLMMCVDELEGNPVILLVLNSRCSDSHLQDLRRELEAAFPHLRSSVYNHCAVVFLWSRRERNGAHPGGDDWMPEEARQLAIDCGSRWCLYDEDDDESDNAITSVDLLIAKVAGHDVSDDDPVSAGNVNTSDISEVTERDRDVRTNDVRIGTERGRDRGRQSFAPVARVLPMQRPTTAPPRTRPTNVDKERKLPEIPHQPQALPSSTTEKGTQTTLKLPPIRAPNQRKKSPTKVERETQTTPRLPCIGSPPGRGGVKPSEDRQTQTDPSRSRVSSCRRSAHEAWTERGSGEEGAQPEQDVRNSNGQMVRMEAGQVNIPAQNQQQLDQFLGLPLDRIPPTIQAVSFVVNYHYSTGNQNYNVQEAENVVIGNQGRIVNQNDS